MAGSSLMRPDSTSSLARLPLFVSRKCGALDTRASRRCVAMLGLLSTAATPGSANSSRILAMRCPHSSRSPSSWASSNTARAYRLAAAVATSDLLDGSLDQASMLRVVKRLADHLLRRGDDEVRDLGAHGADGLVSLGLDLLPRVLDAALGFFALVPHLLAERLRRLGGRVEDALRGLAGVVELGGRLLELCLGGSPRLLGLLQLLGDGALARLCDLDDPRVHVAREDGEHHEEGDQLDDHRSVDRDDARGREKEH